MPVGRGQVKRVGDLYLESFDVSPDPGLISAGYGNTFSNVTYTVTSFSKINRALIFQNFWQPTSLA
jgi:hypothetical protein